MKLEIYEEVSQALLDLAHRIETEKRPGYTQGNEDCLHNFKIEAQLTGTRTLQTWGVFFLKHILSIMSVAKNPDLYQAEPIETRFADAINYLKLGWAIYSEEYDITTGINLNAIGYTDAQDKAWEEELEQARKECIENWASKGYPQFESTCSCPGVFISNPIKDDEDHTKPDQGMGGL